MALIHYDIVRKNGGWSIACRDTVGPPYAVRANAEADAAFIAQFLEKAGDEVVLTVEGREPRTFGRFAATPLGIGGGR